MIFGNKANEEQAEKEAREVNYYDSLNLHADKEFRCKTSNDDVYSVNLLHSQKKVVIVNITAKNVMYINYRDILRCDVQQDNATIMESSAGNALTGAILAGTTGAIIGASTKSTQNVCNDLSIRIITNEILNPSIVIPLIRTQINRQSITYKNLITFADEVYSTIVAIIHENSQPQVLTPAHGLPYQTTNPYLAQPMDYSQPSTSVQNYGQPIGVKTANNGNTQDLNFQPLPAYQVNQTPNYQWNAPTLQSHNMQPAPTLNSRQPMDSQTVNNVNIPDLSNQTPQDNQVNAPMRKVPYFQWDTQKNKNGANQS